MKTGDSFFFTVKRPPSKKNNTIVPRGNKRSNIPSNEVRRAERLIGKTAKRAAHLAGWSHEGESLALSIAWDAPSDRIRVVVTKLKETGSPRRFDLQNLDDVVCDALQGACVIRNDRDFLKVQVFEDFEKNLALDHLL